MLYKEDWHKARERFEALWQGEIVDRCCAAVTAPKKGSRYIPPDLPAGKDERLKYWTDGEIILKRNLTCFENTYYGGEAFPQIFINLGAAGHAAFFKNAKYRLEDSLWCFPSIFDLETEPIEFDPSSFLYRKTIELAKYFVDESQGRYFVSMPDTSGNADALAHLHGSENLLVDLLMHKESVHAALAEIQKAWLQTIEEVYEITHKNNEGGSTIGWLHTWGHGKHSQMQSDLSVMISPQLFQEFVMPELEQQSSWMDYALYHFDGIDQIKHLDALLSLKNLKMIQWTHVAGQPSPVEFIPVLRKIQKAGKGLLIFTNPTEFETLMESLSSKGLYLIIQADSEDQAKDILKRVEKLTHE